MEGTRRPPIGDPAAGGAPASPASATAPGGTNPAPAVTVDVRDALSDVLRRLERTAGSLPAGRDVRLLIPPGSSLFLTASEFRALREVADRSRASVVVETEDPLRRQLASMFGLRTLEVGAPPRPRLLPDPEASDFRGGQQLSPTEPVPISSRTNGRSNVAPPDPDRAEVAAAPTTRPFASEPDRQPLPSRTLPPLDGIDRPGDPMAEAPAWDASPPDHTGLSRRTLLIAFAAVLAAVLLAFVAFAVAAFAFARADVVIELKQQPVTAQTTLNVVAENVGSASPDGAVVPGRYVTIDVTVEKTIPTTGSGKIGQAPATGTVQLANPTDAAVEIAAGTVAAGDTGIQVQFVDAVTVPAASEQVPGQAEAQVRAVRPGTVGNLETGELSGHLDSGIYFSNRLAALSGGTDTDGQIVADADIQALEDAAQAAVADEAGRQFGTTLESGTTAIPATFEIADPDVTFDHTAGDAAESVTIRAVYKVTALTYRAEDADAQLREQLLPALSAAAPDGYAIDEASLRLADPEPVDAPEPDAPGASFTVSASARAVATFSPEDQAALADQLAGSSDSDAEAILRDHPAVDGATIEHTPPWPTFGLPDDTDRIDISVED